MSSIGVMAEETPAIRSFARAELESLVAGAELPPLLATLAFLLGDQRLIAPEFTPPLTPAQAGIFPQGGMSAEQQERARTAAVNALVRYQSGERAAESMPVEKILDFLTAGQADGYTELLHHELGYAPNIAKGMEHRADISGLRVAVIGAGMSGLAMSQNLQSEGVDHVVFEKNDDCGGTWLENRYPGCRLDTSNFAYSFSFAQRSDWPDQFSKRDDIWAYFSGVADDLDLRRNIRFGVTVDSIVFDDDASDWVVSSVDRAGVRTVERFDAVVSAVGQLNTPKLPDIPGIEDFRGEWCHSATWTPELEIAGKRVAVVGTGASAYQIVPTIVDEVGSLTVVQRSAPWMMPTPGYQAPLDPGMVELLALLPEYAKWLRFWQFWLAAEGRMSLVVVDPEWDRVANGNTVSAANAMFREQLEERIRAQYVDRPELIEKVVPNYPPGGKRLLRDDGVWARAITAEHAELVTDRVVRVTPTGIVLETGREIEVDVIVYATGFTATDFLSTITVEGRGGADLHEFWSGEARAYKGVSVPGFPNLFLLYGPNTNLVVTGSAIFMSESAAEYTVRVLKETVHRGVRTLDVTADAYERYVSEIDAANRLRAWGVDGFQSWYKTAAGTVTQNWPLSLHRYFEDSRSVVAADYEALGELNTKGR